METEASLAEARARVGRTMNVDPRDRMWTATEVRWLVEHWTLFHPALARMESLADDLAALRRPWPVPIRAVSAVGGAVLWWYGDSPRILRATTAFLVLFAYAFGYGWMAT